MRRASRLAFAFALVASLACSAPTAVRRADGIDASTLPEAQRADYAVFAQRCSKCHSLARPLDSGIDDPGWWASYVARMRAMPGSGISAADEAAILRFLTAHQGPRR